MNKQLEALKSKEVKKSQLSSIKGGTSTTVMIEVGRSENEYPDDGTGKQEKNSNR